MAPYGIIYTDGAYSFEQSVNIWQKKFGVMKISQLVKTTLIINVILAVVYALAAVILKDKSYLLYYLLQFFATAAIKCASRRFYVFVKNIIKAFFKNINHFNLNNKIS